MTASHTNSDSRWLFGPVPDLLLGCGVLYLVVFAMQAAAGDALRAAVPLSVLPLLSLALGAPHYGATILQACVPDSEGKTRVFFALWIGALLMLAFSAGLEHLVLGSLIVTLYVTWSPWHYSGQNYGILLILMRRRGVETDVTTKRWLRAAFIASYGLTFVALHSANPAGAYAPVSYKGTLFEVIPLGIQPLLRDVLFFGAVGVFGAGSLIGWTRLLRRASIRVLAPGAVLWLMQTLWFVAPPLARHWPWRGGIDPLAPENAAYTMMWIAVGHFVQYLWITSYFAKSQGNTGGVALFLGKALAAGAAMWVLPPLLFAPRLLGSLPFDMGLGVLAASVVNLHHFIVDGVIWKSQLGPIARRLHAEATPAALGVPSVGRWVGRATWAVGTVCVLVAFVGFWEATVGLKRAAAREDLERVEIADRRLDWIGRESPRRHAALARHALRKGDRATARREIDASLAVHPTAEAWLLLGSFHEGSGHWRAAVGAYERALELEPESVPALYRAGVALLRSGEPERARVKLSRAAELDPEHALALKSLERARDLAAPVP